jgi:hypothetical protein
VGVGDYADEHAGGIRHLLEAFAEAGAGIEVVAEAVAD